MKRRLLAGSAVLWLASAFFARANGPEIKRLSVEKFEDGPALHPPEAFAAGETVYFSFFLEGYGHKKDEEKVDIRFEAQPKDPAGVPLTEPVIGTNQAILTPEDKGWVPKLRGSFALPLELLPGKYQIDIRLSDLIAGVSLEKSLPFEVEGPEVPRSVTLAIRDFSFVRSEEDARPMEPAVYRIEEEVHARFFIVGYAHSGRRAIDVGYGISLTDRDGRVLFGQEEVARDRTSAFYPKPYIPGILSFHLKPGTPPGEFTLHVTAQDAVGLQKAESSRTFRME